MKKLILRQEQIEENKWQYRVMQVTNAVSPKVGSVLSESETKRFCHNDSWSVTIKGE